MLAYSLGLLIYVSMDELNQLRNQLNVRQYTFGTYFHMSN